MKTKKTNILRPVPISLTEDMVQAMLLHSRKLKSCPRPKVGSISCYARVAIIERLKRDGLDMGNIDDIYKSMT